MKNYSDSKRYLAGELANATSARMRVPYNKLEIQCTTKFPGVIAVIRMESEGSQGVKMSQQMGGEMPKNTIIKDYDMVNHIINAKITSPYFICMTLYPIMGNPDYYHVSQVLNE